MKKMEGFYAGINFGGWFSQCDYSRQRLDGFITEEDFAQVKAWGFDHIRLPVDYNVFEDDFGGYIEEGFQRVQRVIDLCQKYSLNMVLDLHKTAGFSFDEGEAEAGLFENEAYQLRFYRLWEEFSRRFAANSHMLAFELLNEVTDPAFMPKWNEIASKAIAVIRRYSKDIPILVGGYYNNSAEAVSAIDVPIDENIVFNFHCYEPLVFTHQGAYWISTMDRSFRMDYKSDFASYLKAMEENLWSVNPYFKTFDPETKPNAEFFRNFFAGAVEAAEKKGVALYCGEYGVIELADLEQTKLWYEEIQSIFAQYGIGHALWTYRGMDFDFVSPRMAPVRDAIIQSCKQ